MEHSIYTYQHRLDKIIQLYHEKIINNIIDNNITKHQVHQLLNGFNNIMENQIIKPLTIELNNGDYNDNYEHATKILDLTADIQDYYQIISEKYKPTNDNEIFHIISTETDKSSLKNITIADQKEEIRIFLLFVLGIETDDDYSIEDYLTICENNGYNIYTIND